MYAPSYLLQLTKSIRSSRLVLSVSVALLIFTSSCGGNENKANILPPDIQYMADTMLSHRRRAIIKDMDSICQMQSNMIIQMATDSFVSLELARIKKIRR